MSMSGYYDIGAGSDAESIRAIHRALDLGVTHLDTAEVYGPYTPIRKKQASPFERCFMVHHEADRSGDFHDMCEFRS